MDVAFLPGAMSAVLLEWIAAASGARPVRLNSHASVRFLRDRLFRPISTGWRLQADYSASKRRDDAGAATGANRRRRGSPVPGVSLWSPTLTTPMQPTRLSVSLAQSQDFLLASSARGQMAGGVVGIRVKASS